MTPLERASQALQKAADEKNRRRLQDERQYLVGTIGKDLVKEIAPALDQMVRDNGQALNRAIDSIKRVKMPEVVVPEIQVPTPQVDVNVDLSSLKIPSPTYDLKPVVNIPDIKFPETQQIEGWVKLMGVSMEKPLPVTLRNADGSPANLLENLTTLISGNGGGRGVVRIGGIDQSAWGQVMDSDGRLKVILPSGSSGLTDTELRAAHLDVQQLSGAVDSVYVTGIFGTTFVGSEFVNSDNRLRVSVETGGSGLTDAELRAAHLDVQQVSGSIDSVKVTGFDSSVAVSILNGDGTTLDPRDRNWTITETVPVSGTFWQATQPVSGTVAVSGITNTVASNIVDSTGVAYSGSNPVPVDLATALDQTIDSVSANQVSGSNFSVYITGSSGTTATQILNGDGTYRDTFPVSGTVVVSSITATTASNIVDSTGVAYSGSNPIPAYLVASSANSVVVVGPVASDVADSGHAPVKQGGIARQANPTAVAAGDIVSATYDDLGRQVMRPVQVRDLIGTAYATLTSGSGYGTETALYAGASGEFHDLIYILASNSSTAATSIDVRSSTAGTVIMHLEIPANGVVGVSLPVPLRGHETAQSWTIDAPDTTGGNVYVSALFSIEV